MFLELGLPARDLRTGLLGCTTASVVVAKKELRMGCDDQRRKLRRRSCVVTRFATSCLAVAAVSLGCVGVVRGQASWGVAATAEGSFYFCDITRDRVWKLEPTGELRTAATQNHCHSLVLGYDGNIYAEDIGGESRGELRVALWRMTPAGHREDFLALTNQPDPSRWLVRDAAGNTYAWKGQPGATSEILKRTPQGAVSLLAGGPWGHLDEKGASARLGNIGAMAVTADGILYVVDEGHLRRIDPDAAVSTVTSPLLSTLTGGLPGVAGLYNHSMGMAVDSAGSVYVVDYGNRRIVRIGTDGRLSLVAESKGLANRLTGSGWGWRPTGVCLREGSIYVLEDWPLPVLLADLVGSPRLLKVRADGSTETMAAVASPWVRGAVGLLVVLSTVSLLGLMRVRRGRAPRVG